MHIYKLWLLSIKDYFLWTTNFFNIKLQLQWVKTFYWRPVFSTTFFFNVIEDLMVVGIFRLHWSPLEVEL